MKANKGLSLEDIAFLQKVYQSCKTDEHRATYFAWEAKLFQQAQKGSSLSALKIEKYLSNRLR